MDNINWKIMEISVGSWLLSLKKKKKEEDEEEKKGWQ